MKNAKNFFSFLFKGKINKKEFENDTLESVNFERGEVDRHHQKYNQISFKIS